MVVEVTGDEEMAEDKEARARNMESMLKAALRL